MRWIVCSMRSIEFWVLLPLVKPKRRRSARCGHNKIVHHKNLGQHWHFFGVQHQKKRARHTSTSTEHSSGLLPQLSWGSTCLFSISSTIQDQNNNLFPKLKPASINNIALNLSTEFIPCIFSETTVISKGNHVNPKFYSTIILYLISVISCSLHCPLHVVF